MTDKVTIRPESQAYRKHFSELVHSIRDPEWLASELFSERMISQEVLDDIVTSVGISCTQKARRLLCHFKSTLDDRPEHFRLFLVILRKERSLQWLVNRIEATFRKVKATWTEKVHHSKQLVTNSGIQDEPESSVLDTPVYASPNIAKYASYLRLVYKSRHLPICQKWPPTPSKKYINLALIKKDDTTLAEAYELTTARLHGNIDQILKKKQSISMQQVLIPDSDCTHIKCVLVEGAPGVGKSTFAWELCRNWDTMAMLSSYSLVILIHLREKKAQEASNLSDLLYHRNSAFKESVAKDIDDTEGEGVFFVFDGFDELSPEQRAPGSIFVDIVNGLYLPQATVLITSRPSVTSELISRCKPQISKHIEILGFTEENIKEYSQSIFQNKLDFSEFLNYISSNPLVYSMMYIPLNSAIVVEIYRQNHRTDKPVPKTMTQLYDALSHALLRRHIVEKAHVSESYCMPTHFQDLPVEDFQQFCEICKLAFIGVRTQQLTWNDLPPSFDHFGFMSMVSSLHVEGGPEVTFNFLHLTVQEFLAAYHISLLPGEEQRQLFGHYFETEHFQVVWRFLAGLTSYRHLSWDTVKEKNQDESPKWLKADYCLKPLAVHCLYESQDPVICREFCANGDIGFLPDTASPFDCYALSYCIANSHCTWILDFISAGIDCGTLDMFVKGLNANQGIQSHIKELKIGKNHIGKQGISSISELPTRIISSLPILKLYNCDLDRAAFDHLAELIPFFINLKELDLGVNPVGNGGTEKLIQSLSKLSCLQLLDIANTAIGHTDLNSLSVLIKPPSPLKVLKIGDDAMHPSCTQHMLNVVFGMSSLEHLDLRDIDLTNCTDIIYQLLSVNKNLKVLEFVWCKMGQIVAKLIANALHLNCTMNILKIKHPSVGIEPEGAVAFAEMLKVNETLKELTILSDDSLSTGAVELQNALHHNTTLKTLKLPD